MRFVFALNLILKFTRTLQYNQIVDVLSKNAFADKNDHKNYSNMLVSPGATVSVKANMCTAKGSMVGLPQEPILKTKIIKMSMCFHQKKRKKKNQNIQLLLNQVWRRLWKVGGIF